MVYCFHLHHGILFTRLENYPNTAVSTVRVKDLPANCLILPITLWWYVEGRVAAGNASDVADLLAEGHLIPLMRGDAVR